LSTSFVLSTYFFIDCKNGGRFLPVFRFGKKCPGPSPVGGVGGFFERKKNNWQIYC
jgi:hypothetical protein